MSTRTVFPIFYAIFSLSYSKHKIRRIRWAHAWGTHGREEEDRVLGGKPEGERLGDVFRHRWEDNVKKDIKGGMNWINLSYLAWDRDMWHAVMNVVMHV
jgi:hypothetical protein